MSREKGDKQLHTYQVITLRVEGEWTKLIWKNIVRKIIAIRKKKEKKKGEAWWEWESFSGNSKHRVVWSLGPIALDTENRGSDWEIFGDLTMSCDLDAQEQRKVVRLHPPLT